MTLNQVLEAKVALTRIARDYDASAQSGAEAVEMLEQLGRLRRAVIELTSKVEALVKP